MSVSFPSAPLICWDTEFAAVLLPYEAEEEDEVLFIADVEEVALADMTVDELLAKSRAKRKDRLRSAGAESLDEPSAGATAASLEEPSAGAAVAVSLADPSAGVAGAVAGSFEDPSAEASADEPSAGAAGVAGADETTPDPKL
jgi:hypothetical protein